ncbi:MAG: NUDIX domain-containing protein [Candidatus Dojkabacteria bacterium]
MKPDVKFLLASKAAILNEANQILLLQRAETAESYPLYWDLPGGRMQEEDDPNSVIFREVKEETAIEITEAKPLHLTKFMRNEDLTVGILFVAKIKGEVDVVISSEHAAYKWVNLDEIVNYQIQPWLKEALLSQINNLRS